jgi:DNA ligase-1
MLCYPFEEKRLAKWELPYLVQPKLDGVRCRAKRCAADKYILLSSEEKEIISMPHISMALNKMHYKPDELDGELYCHHMPFEEIVSRTSRTANVHSGYEDIRYYIFDIVDETPQHIRTINLMGMKEHINPPLKIVPTEVCSNLDEILRTYDKFVGLGYEGIIVRHISGLYTRRRSIYVMKFKPKKDDYYTIINYKEEYSIHGEPKGRLGALICASSTVAEESFAVGTGFTDAQREALWTERDKLIGKLAHVKYQHITTGKGVPRFPVFISIIDAEPKGVMLKYE